MNFPFDTSGGKNNIQAAGSAISYGKRYTMSALLNITTHDEDDDASSVDLCIGEQSIARLNTGLEKANTELQVLLNHMCVVRLSEIKAKNFNQALLFLKGIIEGKKNDK